MSGARLCTMCATMRSITDARIITITMIVMIATIVTIATSTGIRTPVRFITTPIAMFGAIPVMTIIITDVMQNTAAM